MKSLVKVTVALTFVLAIAAPAHAGAIQLGFNSSSLAANDDGSTGLVGLGFAIDFFGLNTSNIYINNNGNITFTEPLGTFTPFNIISTGIPMIAPFFADVDTRSSDSELVTYGGGTFDGRAAFGVNWGSAGGAGVDYFSANNVHTNVNNFQLIIVERFDTGAGNFDFMFNYDRIQWQAGQASGSDENGCGGSPARAGWSNGTTATFELPGSGVNTAFIDSGTCVGAPGAFALILNSLNSNIDGRYLFEVREGTVRDVPGVVPEPSTLLLLGGGLAVLASRLRARRNAAK